MTAHGLCATMISLLTHAGYFDAAIVLRSGLQDMNSLQHYHNLRGRNGEQQLNVLFGQPLSTHSVTNNVCFP